MVPNPFWNEVRELICSYQMSQWSPTFPILPEVRLGPLNQLWPMDYEQRGCGVTSGQRQLRADASPSSFSLPVVVTQGATCSRCYRFRIGEDCLAHMSKKLAFIVVNH